MKISTALTAATVTAIAGAASADVLLTIDLSVADQVTITATDGLSAVTESGSNFTGIYFADFYAAAGSSLSATLVAGDLTSVGNASDNSPSLFRAGAGSDTGLNMWSFSTDSTVGFTMGEQAFTGSATWDLSSDMYADMLAGATSGDIYFPADDASDIAGASILGQYQVIPTPGVLSLAGLGLAAAARRRR